ncbi:uncharacterized protein TNCV_454331 [Trichonephila clavipes]|nr:uncharacterized protein TNCV_454331 [Trichonephila clavipes]
MVLSTNFHNVYEDVCEFLKHPPPWLSLAPGGKEASKMQHPRNAPWDSGTTSNIPPPPTYSKSSPSFTKKSSQDGLQNLFNTPPPSAVSRVVYPKECYRPLENVSSFETDNEDFIIQEDDSTERSITPPSLASCPETQRPVFTVDGNIGESTTQKTKDPELAVQLTPEQSNGKMSDIVRKISASIMSEKKKKPGSLVIEALKKSASSSNIVDAADGGASSESSSSVVSEEKVKKKKFFQTLRHRKPKI